MSVARTLSFSRFNCGLRLAALAASFGAQSAAASAAPVEPAAAAPAAWPVPAGVFSLDDERMNAWAAQPRTPAVLTGRLLNLPADQRSKVTISASLVTLQAVGQVAVTCALQPDDTFRLELDPTFPRQQLWLRIKPFYYGEIILGRDLHLELDVAKIKRPTATVTPGLVFGGPDGPLNSEVNRFGFAFKKDRQNEITQALNRTADAMQTGDFAAGLAKLAALRHDYEQIIREFAPQESGWFLQSEIDGHYFTSVLRAAAMAKRSLAGTPLWQEIARHPSYAVTNDQVGYYYWLHSYLVALHAPRQFSLDDLLPAASAVADAAPELQEAYRQVVALNRQQKETGHSDAAAFKTYRDQLRQAGLLSPVPVQLRALNEAAAALLPPGKLAISHLSFVPREAEEARLVIVELQRTATQAWLRDYLQSDTLASSSRLAAINATLAQARTGGPATTLGQPLAELPAGAKLYQFPDLGAQALLAKLIQAFPGKALILDFWGPWCVPCLADLPHSRQTRLALKDEPVEFVYLGSRTTDGPWRRSIAELQLAGTHVLLETKQVDDLMAFFGAGGFPSYIFIDRAGKHRTGVIDHFANTTPDKIRALLR